MNFPAADRFKQTTFAIINKVASRLWTDHPALAVL